jgi:hypothetical protein
MALLLAASWFAAVPPAPAQPEGPSDEQGPKTNAAAASDSKAITDAVMAALKSGLPQIEPQIKSNVSAALEKELPEKLRRELLAAISSPGFAIAISNALRSLPPPKTAPDAFSTEQKEYLSGELLDNNATKIKGEVTLAFSEVVKRYQTNTAADIASLPQRVVKALPGRSVFLWLGAGLFVVGGLAGFTLFSLLSFRSQVETSQADLQGEWRKTSEAVEDLKTAGMAGVSDAAVELIRQKMEDMSRIILDAASETSRQVNDLVKDSQAQSAASRASLDGVVESFGERGDSLVKELEAQSKASRESLEGVVARFRDQGENTTALLAEKLSTASLAPISEKARELTGVIGGLQTRLQSMEGVFNNFGAVSHELSSKINHFGSASADLSSHIEDMKTSQAQLNKKMDELRQKEQRLEEDKKKEADRDNALVPSFFRQGGPLHQWLDRARHGERHQDVAAIRLMGKLREFEALAHPPHGEPDVHPLALALHELSREAHAFWKKQDGDFIETAIAWREAFNTALKEIPVPLQIQAIFPKDRFDAAVMIPAEVSSDNRLFVKEPLSWAILDVSNPERSKVLHYAQVVTI